MQKKTKWKLFAISFALLSSCAPKPPDVPACKQLGLRQSIDPVSGHILLSPSPTCMEKIGEPECGYCVLIVSGKEIFIGEDEANRFNGKTWSGLKEESILLPAEESYARLSDYLINACKKMDCSEDVNRFKIKLDSLKDL